MTHPRLTVRTRLTLLYTGLFTLFGAIIVGISYALVARLGTVQDQQLAARNGLPAASIVAQCHSGQQAPQRDKHDMVQCVSALQQQAARAQRDLILSHLLQYSLITLAAVIVLAAVLGWVFSGRSLRPLHRITAAARAASEHNLSARVAPTGPRDELRELAETFDAMLTRLQAAFEGQRRFIANASHELRTPLAVMRTSADVVLDNPDATPGDLRAMGEDIRAATGRAEHLIGALLILARNERGLTTREDVDLATVAEDVLDTAAPSAVRIHATLDPAVIIGDPVLAERLVANLIDNAVRYNLSAGEVWISTRTMEGSSQLTVDNTGLVISAAEANRIFEPFQRLGDRATHDGFGLGLAIVASIATIHGGAVTARPRNGGGLSVTVTIPSPAAPARGAGIRATGRQAVPPAGLPSARLDHGPCALAKVRPSRDAGTAWAAFVSWSAWSLV